MSIRYVVNSMFDLDEPTPVDNSIDLAYDTVLYDNVAGVNAPVSLKQFKFVNNNLTSWLDMSRAMVRIQCRLLKTANADQVTLTSNILGLFDRATLKAGGVTISDISADYDVFAHVEEKFYSKEFLDTAGSNMFIYPNRGGDPPETILATGAVPANDHPEFNVFGVGIGGGGRLVAGTVTAVGATGHQVGNVAANTLHTDVNRQTLWNSPDSGTGKRFSLTNTQLAATPKLITCWIPLSKIFPVFNQFNKVVTGIPWEIDLYRHSSNLVYTHATAAADIGTLEWRNAGISLHIPTIKPMPGIETKLINRLTQDPPLTKSIFYHDAQVYRTAMGTDLTGRWVAVSSDSYNPAKIIICCKLPGAKTDIKVDNGVFISSGITKLQIKVNGLTLPQNAIESNWDETAATHTRDYAEPYDLYLKSGGVFDGPMSEGSHTVGYNHLSAEDFARSPFWVIDLSKRSLGGVGFSGRAQITVDWTRTSTTQCDMYAVVYSERQLLLEMSSVRGSKLTHV